MEIFKSYEHFGVVADNLVEEGEERLLVGAKQGVYHIRHLAQQIRVLRIFVYELLLDHLIKKNQNRHSKFSIKTEPRRSPRRFFSPAGPRHVRSAL